MTFQIRLVAYEPNGNRISVLPMASSINVSFPFNDVGALTFSYSKHTHGADILESPVEIAVEYWDASSESWVEPANGRFLRLSRSASSTDRTAEVAYTCPGYGWLLSKAIVEPDTVDRAQPRNMDGSPGSVVSTLVAEAKVRGALVGLDVTSFGAGTDSSGSAWSLSIPYEVDAGANLLTVVHGLAESGALDYRFEGRELKLYNVDTVIAGDSGVILHPGRDITDGPTSSTLEDVASSIYVLGEESYYAKASSVVSPTPWGPWEVFASIGGVKDTGELTRQGAVELQRRDHEAKQITRALTFTGGSPVPFKDYEVGQTLDVDEPNGPFRIRQLTLSKDKELSGNVVLNDRFQERLVRLARKVNAVGGGAATIGGSGAVPAPGPSQTIPDVVTGVSVSTVSYLTDDGTNYARASVSWNAVTDNTDGSEADDLRRYDVEWRRTGTNGWFQSFVDADETSAVLDGIPPGVSVDFRVRAVDSVRLTGEWSSVYTVVTAVDTTAPNQPSAPSVYPYLGTLVVEWDGLDSGAGQMPVDWHRTDIHMSTSSGFTPSAATLVGSYVSPGQWVASDLTYGTTVYVKLVAVDRTGNESTPSAQASGSPERIVNTDIVDDQVDERLLADDSVGSAAIQDLAVGTAHIQDLAVTNAKIGGLSANKITTGELQAGARIIAGVDGGTRAEITSSGLKAYRSNAPTVATVSIGTDSNDFLKVTDAENVIKASISGDGAAGFNSVAAESVAANLITLAGRDIIDHLDDLPRGIVAYGNDTVVAEGGSDFVAVPANDEFRFFETAFEAEEGRLYTFQTQSFYWGTQTSGYRLELRYTTDGSDPINGTLGPVDMVIGGYTVTQTWECPLSGLYRIAAVIVNTTANPINYYRPDPNWGWFYIRDEGRSRNAVPVTFGATAPPIPQPDLELTATLTGVYGNESSSELVPHADRYDSSYNYARDIFDALGLGEWDGATNLPLNGSTLEFAGYTAPIARTDWNGSTYSWQVDVSDGGLYGLVCFDSTAIMNLVNDPNAFIDDASLYLYTEETLDGSVKIDAFIGERPGVSDTYSGSLPATLSPQSGNGLVQRYSLTEATGSWIQISLTGGIVEGSQVQDASDLRAISLTVQALSDKSYYRKPVKIHGASDANPPQLRIKYRLIP